MIADCCGTKKQSILVAFRRPFISNPDLVRRLREGAPLNPLGEGTLYGGGVDGYMDYPTPEQAD